MVQNTPQDVPRKLQEGPRVPKGGQEGPKRFFRCRGRRSLCSHFNYYALHWLCTRSAVAPIAASLNRCVAVSLYRSIAASLHRCIAASLHGGIAVSLHR